MANRHLADHELAPFDPCSTRAGSSTDRVILKSAHLIGSCVPTCINHRMARIRTEQGNVHGIHRRRAENPSSSSGSVPSPDPAASSLGRRRSNTG
ncbi:hypothetical protein ACLOJK_006553 [Asimina triloba]